MKTQKKRFSPKIGVTFTGNLGEYQNKGFRQKLMLYFRKTKIIEGLPQWFGFSQIYSIIT